VVSGSGSPNGRPAIAAPLLALSAAEKAELIQKDPDIRAVLETFGGDVELVREQPDRTTALQESDDDVR
jgi:hypothetical protein